MAWAAKCDRCGKYYDYYKGKNRFGFMAYDREADYQEVINGGYDLCPDCMKSLEDWYKEIWSEKLQERMSMSHEEWLRTEYDI